MPTYEYRCTSCGDRFEIVQSFKDASLSVCDKCQGVLRKVYGNVGISFKGTGFYKNDSMSSTGTGAASPASSESSTTKTDTATPSTESSSSDAASTGSSHGAVAASTPAAT